MFSATQRLQFQLEAIKRDVFFSFRSLRRASGLSLAVITTLALCIGGNTTIMSVLYGVILKPLPFRDPDRLVEVYSTHTKGEITKGKVGIQQYLDYKNNADMLAGFAMWTPWAFNAEQETNPSGFNRYLGVFSPSRKAPQEQTRCLY
jgi:putative ABC transport system permease protein